MEMCKKKISDLVVASYNPREKLKPGDKEYEKLKKSIMEFGYVDPIIWNKQTGNVVGGHQRLVVLKELNYTEINCVVIDEPLEKEKALNIALNKIAGDWDMPLLKDLLSSLNDNIFDISLTGFDDDELENLFKNIEPLDLDEKKNNRELKTCHCPKCGFIFEVE